MRKALITFVVLVVAQVVLVLVYLGVDRNRGDRLPNVERPGTPVPDLSVQSSDGSELRVSELRGSTVLLHFWATWCPPCRDELPSLFAYASETDVELLAVSVDPHWDAVRSFAGGRSLEHVYLAPSDAVSKVFGVDELPQTLVIDPTGIVCLHFRDAQDWGASTTRQLVKECIE